MKKTALIIFALIISVNFSYAQESGISVSEKDGKLFTAKDLMQTKRLGDPQISPDGTKLLARIGIPSIAENKINNDIYVFDINGSSKKRIVDNDASDYNARWSPDGKKIAFISTRDGAPQIYVMDYPDGQPVKVTDMENGVANMAWSPDGKYFSFTSDVKLDKFETEKYPDYPAANVRIYDDLPVRHWDHWVDEYYSHLFIIPVEGGEPKDLMEGEKYETPLQPFGGGEEIAWSPDSKEIAYTSKKVQDFETSTNSDIYLVNIESGDTKNITEGMMGFDKYPAYSPDGGYIAFTSQRRAGFESDRIRLMLFDRDDEEITEMTGALDQWVYEYTWAPNSTEIYFTASNEGKVPVYKLDIRDRSWQIFTSGQYKYGSGLAVTPDGSNVIVGRQTFSSPVEFYSIPAAGGDPENITKVNFMDYMMIRSPKVEERWITSTDGAKVHCWIIYPPDFDEYKEYPMITYAQGGPQSMISPYFHYRWNLALMASHGYVVLAPNRRGLPGFGQDWNDAISKDWGGQPMLDLLAATDEMKKEDYIDEDALCSVGASAGGYAAFWLAGNHEGRFKAFISHCGVFNLESMYGSTEELWFPNWEYGGPYWDLKNKEQYETHSPHRYAQNWDTPILISTGEYDFRVPYTQSLEAFTVAQVKNIPSKLIVFPDETHFIAHPQEFLIWSSEFFNFLDKYTKK